MPTILQQPGTDGREKIIVAVHGIGDQTQCETIQQVARQFCKFYRLPDTIPLGHLYSQLVESGSPARPASGVFRHDAIPGVGFAEVYWAGVPRVLERKNYTLEDAKQWAKTIVGRVAQRVPAVRDPNPSDTDQPNYELAEQVIGELIDAVDTVEKLCWLATRARLVQFGLKQVLMDYLGDVQVVTEFAAYRHRILELFHETMTRVHKSNSAAEIYIIAHSEGTVLSMLALLEALQYADSDLSGHEQYHWAGQVRGLMTLGSPLDTHLLLWPELWAGLKPSGVAPQADPIPWRNYFDYGDPIGERLFRIREWLGKSGWDKSFSFSDEDDIGFTRYLFPGKAHLDYWTDDDVFSHFLHTVVHPVEPLPRIAGDDGGDNGTENEGDSETIPRPLPEREGSYAPTDEHRPQSRFLPELLSPMLPFMSAAALLLVAVFLFYKGAAAVALPFCESPGDVARNVAAVTLLLGGATVVTRVPRLTTHWSWRGSAIAGFLASLVAVPFLLTQGARDRLGATFGMLNHVPGGPAMLQWLNDQAHALSRFVPDLQGTTLGVLVLTSLGVMIVGLIGCMRPGWGAKPLAVMGACAVMGLFFARLGGEEMYDQFAQTRQRLRADPRTANAAEADARAIHWVNAYASSADHNRQSFKQFKSTRMDVESSDGRHAATAAATGTALASQSPPATASAPPTGPQEADAQPAATLEIWPLFLTCAAFLYLWYCAMLIFDLSVVWHHYIRQSAILEDLGHLGDDSVSDEAIAEIDRLLIRAEQSAA